MEGNSSEDGSVSSERLLVTVALSDESDSGAVSSERNSPIVAGKARQAEACCQLACRPLVAPSDESDSGAVSSERNSPIVAGKAPLAEARCQLACRPLVAPSDESDSGAVSSERDLPVVAARPLCAPCSDPGEVSTERQSVSHSRNSDTDEDDLLRPPGGSFKFCKKACRTP